MSKLIAYIHFQKIQKVKSIYLPLFPNLGHSTTNSSMFQFSYIMQCVADVKSRKILHHWIEALLEVQEVQKFWKLSNLLKFYSVLCFMRSDKGTLKYLFVSRFPSLFIPCDYSKLGYILIHLSKDIIFKNELYFKENCSSLNEDEKEKYWN